MVEATKKYEVAIPDLLKPEYTKVEVNEVLPEAPTTF